MALSPIPFSGIQTLVDDDLVGIDEAVLAENCFIDDDTIRPRNGYRAATSSIIGSGDVQGIWRFRPSASSARTVVVAGGTVHTVTDPPNDPTTGAVSTIGTAFGTNANVSAAQLQQYLYICADENTPMQRLTPAYTLETLGMLAKGASPTVSFSSLSVLKFSNLASGVLTNATSNIINTDYYQITPSIAGGGVVYDYGSNQNWLGINWLMVIVSPPTQSSGAGTITISLATASGGFERVGEIYDTPGGDAPVCVFCPLTSITNATRSAVRRIQFVNSTTVRPFAVHGTMSIPSAPGVGQIQYNLTFQNSTTKQESSPTDTTNVTFANNPSIPQFHAVSGHYNSFSDRGLLSADPDAMPSNLCFNKSANVALPSRYEFASIPTFAGAIPTPNISPNADNVRLWRLTETGWRLVKSLSYGAGITTYSITDDTGLDTLTHEQYMAGGTAPSMACLTARAQRLIGSRENRIYISSYTPTANPISPYPQFPDIPANEASGWSFDIAPSNAEQVLWLGNGDALYILTNEAAYVMADLEPNSTPSKVFERGVLGRRGACWAEESLFFAAHDGIYALQNRAQASELSQSVRRMYSDWFQPDNTTIVCYQNRKLLVFCGTRYIRYDFVRGRWTRGTVPHQFLHAAQWRDPNGSIQHLWLLENGRNVMRWQPTATTDNGADIPSWRYWTGYEFTASKTRVRSIYVDTSEPIKLSLHRFSEDVGRQVAVQAGEKELTGWGDFTGYKFQLQLSGRGQLKRLLWDRYGVNGEGAERI